MASGFTKAVPSNQTAGALGCQGDALEALDECSPLRLFLVAGEHSGDALGGKLIESLRALSPRPLLLKGVGGALMREQGCPSLFPLAEIAVMGPLDILPRLPAIWRRIRETAEAVIALQPHALVILDSPEFTHQLAKRVRRRAPQIPIVNYVSPTVWAWRPGRARKMRAYVDHILAILPFEPEAHLRLGGPPCSYVGHPLVEKLDWIESLDAESLRRRLEIPKDRLVIVVLPGSRSSEVKRLMPTFGSALKIIQDERIESFEVILPAVDTVRGLVEAGMADWPVTPHLVSSEEDKFAAFRIAGAALAASGTVTLELALAGTPMVVGYRADVLVSSLRYLLVTHSVVLANLVLGENVFPEFLLQNCTPENLAGALLPLLRDGPERERQLQGAARVKKRVHEIGGPPSQRAARIVLDYAVAERAWLSTC
jgi:lipid-A-disaccharide synthase